MPELDDLSSGREALPDSNGSDADFALLPGVPRDNNGRFIKQEPQEPAAPQPQGQQPEPQQTDDGDEPEAGQQRQQGSVPPQALAAERQKRKQAQDQLATMQRELAELRGAVMARQQPQAAPPPAPEAPPEFWQDPNAATDFRVRNAIDPIRQQLDSFKITMSRNLAEQMHGKETVDSAVEALTDLRQANPGEYQRLEAMAASSMHPVDDVVKWHKRQRALSEIGEDPAAYRERVRQELLAEIQQPSTQQQPAAQQAPRLPSSFAAQRSAPPRSDDAGDGPRPASTMLRRR